MATLAPRLHPARRASRIAPAPALAVACACACACGSSGSGSGGRSAAAAPRAIATPAMTADDAPVATVNGRAVWASCVAAQARRIAGGEAERRAAALDQCIAFELLAQSADARGLAAAPEVGDAARTAAVSRLVETEFEQRYRTPADLAPQIDAVLQASPWRLHPPEMRASTFARFIAAKDAPAELDARAHALADRLAGELTGQTGLFNINLVEAARPIAEGSGVAVETSDFRPSERSRLVDSYADALYAIPEVGRTSPAFRTPWGWDVVLWTGGIAAGERSRDEIAAEMFPELRRREFARWVAGLIKQLGVHIEIEDAEVARLDADVAP
jgi:hypothetical protein